MTNFSKGLYKFDNNNYLSKHKVIDLSGWGNSDSCTFEIGKHRIELYVDEYLIHTTNSLLIYRHPKSWKLN